MPSRNQQSHAKRARELAVKEKRELKRAKKAAQRAGEPWGEDATTVQNEGEEGGAGSDAEAEAEAQTTDIPTPDEVS
jgi:hypothetical protein